MKVILKQDVKSQGKKGDIINVSDGYAVNYLIKNNLAEAASNAALQTADARKKAEEHRRAEELAAYKAMAETLKTAEVTLKVKSGENGKIFGSVVSQNISDAISAAGFPEVDKKKIVLDEPIKHTGKYVLDLKLYAGVTAKITVNVVPE